MAERHEPVRPGAGIVNGHDQGVRNDAGDVSGVNSLDSEVPTGLG